MKSIRLKCLPGLVAAVFFLLCTPIALAAPFEMSVILDRAHGELVQKGEYRDAILQISHGDRRLPFAANNNLCVAQTKLDDFEQAELSCDIAVQLAEFAVGHGQRQDVDYVTELAIALSNRGVLRAMTGNPAEAERDFRRAVNLDPNTESPARNLSHLLGGSATAVAKH